jgi:hypothetical protein
MIGGEGEARGGRGGGSSCFSFFVVVVFRSFSAHFPVIFANLRKFARNVVQMYNKSLPHTESHERDERLKSTVHKNPYSTVRNPVILITYDSNLQTMPRRCRDDANPNNNTRQNAATLLL